MDLVRDLARSLRDLDRAARRYDDEELNEAVAQVMRELGAVVEVLGKLADIYEELEVLVKGVLRLDSPAIAEVELKDGEEISSFVERCREAGADPNKALAYLLATEKARLVQDGGKVVLKLGVRKA
ncbi:hypothetical protein TUZN_0236 [Thermoproteus uzoniensis 768-20]|uniref:Uncharacterized protein n=1 Tax=Thermoproteus uzoniensis (strain 768-20) TaxID=999630 RepID=F2L1Z3_THEU7|nr:hypothetical protein [Thermoproteus uzoniensis]AEA11734.1 hypothetical protein TUZN_0236 [Thermoproteus uzoniensis 768-20]